MTTDPLDQPQSLGEVSILYRMLLGQYLQNRKETEIKRKKEGLISGLRKARKGIWDSILPEGHKSGSGGRLDLFACNVIYSGGIDTLESLRALNRATLAALVEWNQINILRTEENLFTRRSAASLIALVSAAASLSNLSFIHNQIALGVFAALLRLWGRVLLKQWLTVVLVIAAYVFMEFVVWRPRRSRLVEFGQILAVAFAYVSRVPSSERKKTRTARQVT